MNTVSTLTMNVQFNTVCYASRWESRHEHLSLYRWLRCVDSSTRFYLYMATFTWQNGKIAYHFLWVRDSDAWIDRQRVWMMILSPVYSVLGGGCCTGFSWMIAPQRCSQGSSLRPNAGICFLAELCETLQIGKFSTHAATFWVDALKFNNFIDNAHVMDCDWRICVKWVDCRIHSELNLLRYRHVLQFEYLPIGPVFDWFSHQMYACL